jgi:peptidyl-prolyl cis-trans isomerase C
MRIQPFTLATALLLTLTTLPGCQMSNGGQEGASSAGQAQGAGKEIAAVNGEAISEAALKAFIAQKQQAQSKTPTDPDSALQELINLELLKQQAEKDGLDKRPEFINNAKLQRARLLVNLYLKDYIQSLNFTDEQLKQEYQTQIAGLPNQEYKARHILSKTEDEAKAIIKELDNGADFAKLAKEKSTGPSGPQGGDLGWFRPGSMVPPFSQAVQSMQKGQHSKTPVKTKFGWHVILLEDTRELSPPPFEEVKDKIKAILVNKALQDRISELRAKADIKID